LLRLSYALARSAKYFTTALGVQYLFELLHQELNQFQIILPKNIERLKSEIKDQLKNNISNVFIATNLIRGFYALTMKEIQANLYKKGFSYKDISKVIQTPYL
jgi:uncharacterized protein (UPF0335 family)